MKDSAPIISVIPYIVVERFIEGFEQKSKEMIHQLSLDVNQVKSSQHRFQLENVHDISYKPFTGGHAHLYLHTHQGVFSFVVNKDPIAFVQAYKRLKGDLFY